MATYIELRDLFNNSALRNRVEVATAVCAYEVLSGGDTNAPYSQVAGAHDKRVRWAGAALPRTDQEAANIFKLVLAANASLTTTQIQNATDTAIQGGVRAVIDEVAAAFVANNSGG